jgi:hypothetical protein
LVTFNGTGRYSEPELTWQDNVAPTSVAFLDSNTLGNNYRYDMFVSTAGGGKIYNFDLSQDRKQLVLKDALADKIVDSNVEDSIIFAKGFTMITDLEMNPYDGSLYVGAPVDGDSAAGSVYKIISTSPPEPIQDPASPNNIIQDPVSPENTIKFPSSIESKQGDQPKNIEETITKNNNSDLSMWNKLKSFNRY